MKNHFLLTLGLLCLILSGCMVDALVEDDMYDGEPLYIGVIGDIPQVREKNINFINTSFEELAKMDSLMHDAIFISENYLSEAATNENIQLYKKHKVPFFFIGTKALNLPFIDHENKLSYEEYAERINNTKHFITGIRYLGENYGYEDWKFSNDGNLDKINIENIYSLVFKEIEKIK